MALLDYVPPTPELEAFHCPYGDCRTFALQDWRVLYASRHTDYPMDDWRGSRCQRCDKWTIWFKDEMVYPSDGNAPLPNPDMPEDIQLDYEEARAILNRSPRGAAALLRLAIQKLCKHLGERGKNIDAARWSGKALASACRRHWTRSG